MNENYLKELNTQQRQAVETIDGPLLIVAGAGTGKTRVIVYRIAHIIKEKKALPSNILAVTFSKKASLEMSERACNLIEGSQDLFIATFHSFCNNLLRDHALDLGLSNDFKLLDRVEEWIFLERMLPDLKLKYYFNPSDPSSSVAGFLRFISRAKDEMVSPDDYLKYVESINEPKEKTRLKEVWYVYDRYQKALYKSSRLDFGDLVNYSHRLFLERPRILREYQDRFRYILVDEFQDTNIAQIELVSLLAGSPKNICVVGDDDQGIYRFRGASYASFIKFKEKFPDLKSIKLTENFRSTKKILNIADSIIKNNAPDRYDANKDLWTKNREGEDIRILKAKDYPDEAKAVVDEILEIITSPGNNYSDIAILYRAHAHKEEIMKQLDIRGIPYEVLGNVGLFEQEEIKDIVAFLKIINDTDDSVSLFRLLSGPFFGADLIDLVTINKYAKEKNISLYAALKNIYRFKIKKETINIIENFKSTLDQLLAATYKNNLIDLLYTIRDKTNMIQQLLINPTKNNEIKILNINRFYNFVNEFIEGHEKNDLRSFLYYLGSYLKAGGDLTSGVDETIEKANFVQLMTIHQAKGLEFPYVFVIGLIQNKFPARQRPDPVPFPVELMKEELPKGNFHLQEERRLFYVAMTRAKKVLYLSYVEKPYHQPSIFVKELLGTSSSRFISKKDIVYEKNMEELIEPPVTDNELLQLNSLRKISRIFNEIKILQSEPKILKFLPSYTDVFYEYTKKILSGAQKDKKDLYETSIPTPSDLRLSYTQINTYTLCPHKYKLAYVYSIPVRPSIQLKFGSDIHKTLKDFYACTKRNRPLSLSKLLNIYERYWKRGIDRFDKIQEKAYKIKGIKILKDFYRENAKNPITPLHLEKEFLLNLEGNFVKGFIDRVDLLTNNSIEIIDYKTGKITDDKNIQLDIYAMAAKEVLRLNPSRLTLYYLDINKRVSMDIDEDRIEMTRKLIIETIANIRNRSFKALPGYKCKWCEYGMLCSEASV